MLDLAKCLPLAEKLANHIVATGARIFGPDKYVWTEGAAEQYNRLWIDEHAADFGDIPNLVQPATCVTCPGAFCLIAAVIHEQGEPRQVVHQCTQCGHYWGVPESVYAEEIF